MPACFRQIVRFIEVIFCKAIFFTLTLCIGGLRTVNVPTELMRKFVDVASPNTRQNRETCAILAGRLVRLMLLSLCNLIDLAVVNCSP